MQEKAPQPSSILSYTACKKVIGTPPPSDRLIFLFLLQNSGNQPPKSNVAAPSEFQLAPSPLSALKF